MTYFKKTLLFLIAVCAAAHICAVPFIAYEGGPLVSMPFDPAEYRILAENLIEGNGFSTSYEAPYTPQALRTPGYPVFLASTLLIDTSWFFAIMLQQVLLVSAAFITGLIVLQLFKNEPLSFLATLLILAEPHLFVLSLNTVTESLFLFLFTLSFYLLSRINKSPVHLIGYAILLSLLIYVRPSALLLVPFFIAGFYMRIGDIRKTLAVVALVCICVSPWIIHIHNVSGSFTFSTTPQFNIVYGLGNSLEKDELSRTITRNPHELTVGAYTSEYAARLAELSETIYERRGASGFIAAQVRCAPKVWFGHYYELFLRKLGVTNTNLLSLASFIDVLVSVILFVGVILGMYVSAKRPELRLYLVVLGGCLAVTTFANLCVSDTRMLASIFSGVVILSAIGVVGFFKAKRLL